MDISKSPIVSKTSRVNAPPSIQYARCDACGEKIKDDELWIHRGDEYLRTFHVSCCDASGEPLP